MTGRILNIKFINDMLEVYEKHFEVSSMSRNHSLAMVKELEEFFVVTLDRDNTYVIDDVKMFNYHSQAMYNKSASMFVMKVQVRDQSPRPIVLAYNYHHTRWTITPVSISDYLYPEQNVFSDEMAPRFVGMK